ncbi:ammonium transporter [Gulosibacter faecalis]|jgi:Amt family ammonium transporter|uniref:Ammonium transporter n=1 Tax=Gulosibacter faecalis TaxID=272240 RepID=A0ABW5V2V0_9MICO|nr:ammonium transporter [Gulosibacter faecalis]
MDTGGAAWLITATALVLFMTPGLALFYGGLVREKGAISMMMMSFGALALVAVLWVLFGHAMISVDGSSFFQFAGNPFADFGMVETANDNEALMGSAYAATFAIITVALISGAIADRARFGSWLLFAGIFATVVYFPVAAWVWGGGWVAQLGTAMGFGDLAVIDYAGGTAVHINAGAAALALALVLGRRQGFGRELAQPHNVPLVLIGTAVLWFGWFGFNVGAEGTGNLVEGIPGLIAMNTIIAPAAGILGWLLLDRIRGKKPSAVGAASGVIAGLVGITPACADVLPAWALLLGFVCGVAASWACDLKWAAKYDDSLDVVGIHLVAGLIGSIWPGLFGTASGLFSGHGVQQLILQVVASVAVLVYSFVVSYVVAMVIQKTIGFRITSEEELAGVDESVHGERAYSRGELGRVGAV